MSLLLFWGTYFFFKFCFWWETHMQWGVETFLTGFELVLGYPLSLSHGLINFESTFYIIFLVCGLYTILEESQPHTYLWCRLGFWFLMSGPNGPRCLIDFYTRSSAEFSLFHAWASHSSLAAMQGICFLWPQLSSPWSTKTPARKDHIHFPFHLILSHWSLLHYWACSSFLAP